MLHATARPLARLHWALFFLCLLGACGLPGRKSYSGSVPPHEDAALDAFLAETRLAAADRVRLANHMGKIKGRSISWVTADPKWIQLDIAQRDGELRRLLTRFGSSSLSPDRTLLFETTRFQLGQQRTAMDWRGRDILWSKRGSATTDDWLLGDSAPSELEDQVTLGDGIALNAWFQRVQEQGNYLVTLERELVARERGELLPAAVGLRHALDLVRTALETQLPQWLALLSTRLAEENSLSDMERAEWRARGAEVLQVALGERLDILNRRLTHLAQRAPDGSLANSAANKGYYRHLLKTATSYSATPQEFHARHLEAVQAILKSPVIDAEQGNVASNLGEYLAGGGPIPTGPDSTSDALFSAWFNGWALYESARSDDLSDLIQRLSAYALSVADTGIHAKGWTREEAANYLEDHTAMDAALASEAIDNIFLYPGHAVGAPVGYEQFLSMRARCERRWGPEFDDKPLHDLIRASGPAPLIPLGVWIGRWMKTR